MHQPAFVAQDLLRLQRRCDKKLKENCESTFVPFRERKKKHWIKNFLWIINFGRLIHILSNKENVWTVILFGSHTFCGTCYNHLKTLKPYFLKFRHFLLFFQSRKNTLEKSNISCWNPVLSSTAGCQRSGIFLFSQGLRYLVFSL